MSPANTSLCYYVLLPMIPAFLLFLTLPKRSSSAGTVQGHFQGLDIKLSGSFAGYFITLILIFHYYPPKGPPPPKEYIVWGRLLNANGMPETNLNQSAIAIQPPQLTFAPDGTFNIRLMVPDGTDLPKLSFSRSGGALQQTVSLEQYIGPDSPAMVGPHSIALGDIRLFDVPSPSALPAYQTASVQMTPLAPVR
jgi:hypothetical protein